jgi:hypothetical protein
MGALTPETKKLVVEINARVLAQITLDERKPGAIKTKPKKAQSR